MYMASIHGKAKVADYFCCAKCLGGEYVCVECKCVW